MKWISRLQFRLTATKLVRLRFCTRSFIKGGRRVKKEKKERDNTKNETNADMQSPHNANLSNETCNEKETRLKREFSHVAGFGL